MEKISNYEWKIPKKGAMKVPAIVYASEKLLKNIEKDRTLTQIQGVAALKGIQRAAFAMPDAHQGYGFPIGGVAAFDMEEGIISPGGVGYDINCGVRLLKTDLLAEEVIPKRKELIGEIFKDVPALMIMIIPTALACSSVGIFIASICKNQQQVGSLSTLIVLGMSALGGSMFPSFIMPKYIQSIGSFTANHWAMKGITDIFWYNKHLADIYPSVLVLLGITAVFSFIAIKIFNKRLME